VTDVAVSGAGKSGGPLARKWSGAGHRITFGARDPDKAALRGLADAIGARTASVAEAIAAGDVVLFAIPGASMAETVAGAGADLDGKIVIDAANNVGGESMHSAATIARAAPGAAYFRAFNTLGWELFDEPTVGGIQVDLFYCGPDGAPRASVERLIADVGLRPVWVGGPEEVEVVDGLLRLWFTLVAKRRLGRRLALRMMQEAG
jgi:predicted dinucleotide-binding enzyme